MIQLIAYGAQDVYLTGSPQITFFKSVYKRHSHFAFEYYKNQITESITNGSTIRITLSRVGDLIGDMFFELPVKSSVLKDYKTDNSSADLVFIAERAFASVELQIGNITIDKHYQTWWRIYSELFMTEEKRMLYQKMTMNVADTATGGASVYLPLLFFFNRNPGLYLPLCALQYHEVVIICTLTSTYANYFDTNVKPILWTNYVTLDKDERRRFTQIAHEYLIEQVQYSSDTLPGGAYTTVPSQKVRIQLRHPVKEIIWCYPNQSGTNKLWDFTENPGFVNLTINPLTANYPNFIGQPVFSPNTCVWTETGDITNPRVFSVAPLSTMKLYFNGQERFEHNAKFLNQVQPYQYHTGNPYPGIYTYSFALKPEDSQPSGTCNFSRIDNTEMLVGMKVPPNGITSQNTTQILFAINYNVLRIQSGLAGIAFA